MIDFTGRHSDLAQLSQHGQSAREKSGCTVLLQGTAGIGKTRLVQHFLELPENEPATILRGSAYLPHDHLLYAPILEAFGHYFQTLSPTKRKQLTAGLADLRLLFPGLECGTPRPMSDDALHKIRLFQCFATLLRRLTAHGPVILFLDDLHWADAVTLELFHYLSTAAAQPSLMLIATLRTEDLQENASFRAMIHSLMRTPQAHTMKLGPLRSEDIKEVFQHQVGGPPSPTLLQQLEHQTGGTPLFLCALLDALQNEEKLLFDGHYWNIREQNWTLPQTVRELVTQRMVRFSEGAQELLQWMAVCPDGIVHTLLAQAIHQDEDTLLSHIQEACVPGFVGETVQQGQTCYRWTHPLVREVIYNDIPRWRRNKLHASLAHLLEQQDPSDDYHLANHYCGMDGPSLSPKALLVLREAGEEAKRLGAHLEASRFFSKALDALHNQPDPGKLPILLEGLGEVRCLLGQTEEGTQLLQEASQHYREHQEWRGYARAQLRLAHGSWSQFHFDEAHQHIEKGLAALQDAEHVPEWERLHATRLTFLDRCYQFEPLRLSLQKLEANLAQQSADFRLAVEACEFGFSMREGRYDDAHKQVVSMQHQASQSLDFVQRIRVHNFAGLLAVAKGDSISAEQQFNTSMALIKEHGLTGCAPSVLCFGGALSLLTGQWEEGLERTQQGMYIAMQTHSLRYHSRMHALRACLCAHLGRFDEATEEYNHAMEQLGDHTDDLHIAASIWVSCGLGLIEQGQYQRAQDLLQNTPTSNPPQLPVDSILPSFCLQAWGHTYVGLEQFDSLPFVIEPLKARGKHSPYCNAWANYFQAQYIGAKGDTQQASLLFQESASTFAEEKHPHAEASTWLAWFRLQTPNKASRHDATNLKHAERMVELWETLSATHRQDEAWSELDRHGITKATLRDQHRYLSKRESEIAELIAKGLKNTEIAKRLHISPHTVSSHLKRIYARLNINTRTELAKFVMTQHSA
ncbi:MAG: hypothetical protein EP343_08840 [Deltaproteobacteria bacterium]|nr:MAG: hypothetical protein EP343_08840 [Deltaproteobacteria bacterium]